ncbi:MAG: hypothetical protein H5U00_09300 [Clostridia bacterium]|nr:hypothetical protein [Clostridia bacterium]
MNTDPTHLSLLITRPPGGGKTTVVRCLLEILPQGALGRDFGPEEIVAAVRASNQAGLACILDLLIGGPQETPKTVAETVRLVKRLEVTAIGVALGVRIYCGNIYVWLAVVPTRTKFPEA